jgi:hypothetical protein
MAAPSVASSTTAEYTSATSDPSITYPSSIASGDLLILLWLTSAAGSTQTTPSGWTAIGSLADGVGVMQSAVMYKLANGTESGSLSLSQSYRKCSVAMLRITGVDGTTPINVSAYDNTTTTWAATANCPTATTTVADCLVLRPAFLGRALTVSGYPHASNQLSLTAIGCILANCSTTQAIAGATGTGSYTWSDFGNGIVMWTIVVAPSAGGGGSLSPMFFRRRNALLSRGR